ncbi:hypothetical protein B1992_04335 [Pseudoxanthomonas broegbernensis]|uniref:Prepilin-type N-terminal cleavage/methylation domain-containing protein n=1 Tax=Pseudoxanthomonas broegbernensis TaxID=83619 RepID=A0A7V8GNN6_9GAMM|nr:prepilin-type N-terminal cleavage/methylation domain-containing protein [Pseudoxanthomonas broegbernensis]KAF1687218.1 hypothetical protein B1992_04335 [Pseudoxanthomonas broegbernensis]MBB6065795.1 prepilin-type N-terminal cleavage/methylation domain-containing protein [Pseudoxanthomonas broegbernensis]
MVIGRSGPLAAGFTLIELMVGIAIMAMLLLAAAPFTRDWVDGTRQMRARSNLLEAVGQARSRAMRNPLALTSAQAGQGAAAVVYDKDGHVLCVISRTADGSAWEGCAAGNWQGAIANPGSLQLKVGQEEDAGDFVCAAYDTRGVLVASSYGGVDCVAPGGTAADVFIKAGNQEVMDVALL